MPAPQDRVQILKQESTAAGGDDADQVEWLNTTLDPLEDAPEVQGLFIQPPGGPRDEAAYISRNTLGDIVFKDPNNTEKKLSDLTGGSGVSYNEFLLDNEPTAETGTNDCVYTPTYSGLKVTKEEWKRHDTTLVKSIDYTYTGNNLTTEVRKVFALNGSTIVAQVTWTYSYSGVQVTSATMVRDV